MKIPKSYRQVNTCQTCRNCIELWKDKILLGHFCNINKNRPNYDNYRKVPDIYQAAYEKWKKDEEVWQQEHRVKYGVCDKYQEEETEVIDL